MLFKFTTITALVLASAAVVTAQTFEKNPCSDCVLGSIPKEKACAALVPVDLQQLQAAFAGNVVNVVGLGTASQNPAIKKCMCNWASNAFSPGGAASGCTGAKAVCNAVQVADARSKIAPMTSVFKCDDSSSSSSTDNTTTVTPPPHPAGAGGATGNSAESKAGVSAVLSLAAVALAAAISL
ncbi:hypothetical protein BGZ94_004507 [Podila epigama]|nr:hypothetical protein BGZ94_004507 [Podila epigama]